MADHNWALGINGASIHEVSHEASHVASVVTNLLLESEDHLWISGDAPQHVTLHLNPAHPELFYAGWHVWHNYVTNPKRVEIASGDHPDNMSAVLVCQALPGAGTQVWRLPHPIPTSHTYVRFMVMETFGSGPTYMNNVVLLSSDPGPRYRAAPALTSETATPFDSTSYSAYDGNDVGVFKSPANTAALNANSRPGGRVSRLLKDLDEDIRNLRQIKSLNLSKNLLLFVEQEQPPQLLLQEPVDSAAYGAGAAPTPGPSTALPNPQPQHQQEVVPSSTVLDRILALERSVVALTQTVQHQREDIGMLKRLMLQQATSQHHEEAARAAAVASASCNSCPSKAAADHPASHDVLVKAGDGISSSLRAPRRMHHNVEVEFPEDALRRFVTSVTNDKLRKHMKKSEAKLLDRVDAYMREVIHCITQSVDERVRKQLPDQQQWRQPSQSPVFQFSGLPPRPRAYGTSPSGCHTPLHVPADGTPTVNSYPIFPAAYAGQRKLSTMAIHHPYSPTVQGGVASRSGPAISIIKDCVSDNPRQQE